VTIHEGDVVSLLDSQAELAIGQVLAATKLVDSAKMPSMGRTLIVLMVAGAFVAAAIYFCLSLFGELGEYAGRWAFVGFAAASIALGVLIGTRDDSGDP
jgi:hypothetical protein